MEQLRQVHSIVKFSKVSIGRFQRNNINFLESKTLLAVPGGVSPENINFFRIGAKLVGLQSSSYLQYAMNSAPNGNYQWL
mgnify:CR=1 FL=1